MEIDWLQVCKDMGEKVQAGVLGEYMLEQGKKEIGVGAGGDKTLVIDKEAEGIILQELDKLGISLLVITEEAGEVRLGKEGKPEKILVIDPLDGSNNTKMGIGVFSLSIAVLDSRDVESVEFAFIKNLYTGDEYYASKGKGAYKNGEQIKTSGKTELEYLTFSKVPVKLGPEMNKWLQRMFEAKHVRSLGSSAIQECLVAEGQVEAFIEIPRGRMLDVIAGKLIIEEAGGVATDWGGKPLKGRASINSSCNFAAFANRSIMEKFWR